MSSPRSTYKFDNLINPENEFCEFHTIQPYVVISESHLGAIRKYLAVHNVILVIDHTNGGHGCQQFYDFNRLFEDIKPIKGDENNAFHEKSSTAFLRLFRTAVEKHQRSCECDCICDNCDPDECKCENCRQFTFISLLGNSNN